MSEAIVYQIKNTKNGKQYIGSTKNKRKRWNSHKKALQRGEHHNIHLQRAWGKYGEEMFDFTILEIVKNGNSLLDREQFYLDKLSPEYNIALDTKATMEGRKHTEKAKEKMSKTHKGKKNHMYGEKHTKKTKEKMKETAQGQEHSKEIKEKISETLKENPPMKGKHHDKEAREKIGKAQKGEESPFLGENHTEETKEKMSETRKGREITWGDKIGKALQGEKSHFAKLTEKKVKIIKHLLEGDSFTQKQIGKMFGVDHRIISNIKLGKNWDHISIKSRTTNK